MELCPQIKTAEHYFREAIEDVGPCDATRQMVDAIRHAFASRPMCLSIGEMESLNNALNKVSELVKWAE